MTELVETEEEYVKKLSHVCEVKFGSVLKLMFVIDINNVSVYYFTLHT